MTTRIMTKFEKAEIREKKKTKAEKKKKYEDFVWAVYHPQDIEKIYPFLKDCSPQDVEAFRQKYIDLKKELTKKDRLRHKKILEKIKLYRT